MNIENPSKEQVVEALGKISWSMKHVGCNHYCFYNHKKKSTPLYAWFCTESRLYVGHNGASYPQICFYLKQVIMQELLDADGEVDAIAFGGKVDDSIFIICQNFDKRRKVWRKSKKSKTPPHDVADTLIY